MRLICMFFLVSSQLEIHVITFFLGLHNSFKHVTERYPLQVLSRQVIYVTRSTFNVTIVCGIVLFKLFFLLIKTMVLNFYFTTC